MWCNTSSFLGSLGRGEINMATNLPVSCAPVRVPTVLSVSQKKRRRKYGYMTPIL